MFPSKELAEAWAEEHERELKGRRQHGGLRPDLTALTVGGLVQEFLEDPGTKSKSEGYVDVLGIYLGWWVGQYGSTKVLDVNVLLLREARAKLAPGRAPATVNRYLASMRSAWNWGRSSGLIPMDMLWPTRLLLQEPTGRTRYLDAAELGRLLTAAAEAGPMLYAAIVVSLATGMRQGELLRLTWADLEADRQLVRLMVTKNKKPRSVHLPASAVAAVVAIKPTEPEPESNAVVFPISKQALMNRWHRIRAAAKLENFRWHDLRHSTASFLAQHGANLLQIGAVLGHSSPAVTRRYAHLVEGAALPAHAELDAMLSVRK